MSDGSFMYVFGGQSGSSGGVPMNDLWSFDGAFWTQMTADGAAGSPPARDRAGVTWDHVRNRLVVFGGEDLAGNPLGDTWEWDPVTNTWADVTPVGTSPSPRKFCALAYDWVSSATLLFGGLDATGTHLNDTWLFDGSSWTPLSPAGPLPGVRRQHVLVERPDFLDVILCGGQEAGGFGMYGDTWRWDGTTWIQVPTVNSPAGRVAIDAAYDSVRKRIVIAGGNPGPTGSISEFDSRINDWVIRPLDPGIYKVTRYFMAFVPALSKIYKVGGQALNSAAPAQSTYEYQSDFVATFTMSGAGCAGGAGVPQLAPTDVPWVNTTTSISVTNVAPTETVVLLTGINNTSWLGFPLPFNLGLVGFQGCTLYVDPWFTDVQGVGPAAPPHNFIWPDVPALAGITFYIQAVVLDTVGGTLGMSALGTGVIGIL